MSLRASILLGAAFLSALAAGCGHRVPQEVRVLRWVEHADALQDAKAALAHGDHRLMAVRGLGVRIPGTDAREFESLERSHGIREMEGTTDALIDQEHHRLVQLAVEYAATYNRHVLRQTKQSP